MIRRLICVPNLTFVIFAMCGDVFFDFHLKNGFFKTCFRQSAMGKMTALDVRQYHAFDTATTATPRVVDGHNFSGICTLISSYMYPLIYTHIHGSSVKGSATPFSSISRPLASHFVVRFCFLLSTTSSSR